MQNVKLLIVIAIFASFSFGASIEELTSPKPFMDLGIQGKTYDIQEEDFIKILDKDLQEYEKSITKGDIAKIVEEQVASAANKTTSLPLCQEDKALEAQPDYAVVPTDIRNPLGRLVYKKGDKILSTMPDNIKMDICYINFINYVAGINQLESMSQFNQKCLFLVANTDVRPLREKYPSFDIYPTSEFQEQRFDIKCYPSVLRLQGSTKQINEFSYETFKANTRRLEL
ncbi:hypothetical protein ACHJH3_06165 [Campylobacter sp. MOP7]|uniref:hypothetical protein n=1 Tax=Campylobacter canis TaxID=3378588 RepID=UPI00387EC374